MKILPTLDSVHWIWSALVMTVVFALPLRAQLSSGPVAENSGSFTNYQNTPVSSILDIYEQLSGKHLIRDAAVASLPPVTINANGVGKEQFLRLVEATLLLNGVTIIPVDGATSKAIFNGSTNKNARSEGVKLFANANDIPADDEVVSYYMPLSYISPTEAVQIFTNQAPVHSYGVYIPVPTAQAVVVTENTSVVRELIALKQLIDIPPARVTSEFVQLTRADAEKVADLLNKILSDKKPATAGAGEVGVPSNVGNDAPMSNEKDLLSGPTQVIADPRSNRILLISRPVNMPFLKQMIAELDRPDDYLQPQSRPLKYVLAGDILPALAAALAQGKDEEDQAKSAASNSPSGANGQNSNPVQSLNAASASSSNGQPGLANGTGAGTSEEPALSDPPQNNVPTFVTIGKTRLLADNRSNSIIVFGTPDVVDRINAMIDQLDRKPLQVYLATVIGQLTVTQGTEFGIDILQKFAQGGRFGAATGLINTASGATAANIPEPTSLVSSSGFPLLSGLNVYGALGSAVDAYVRALETTNRFKVISRPSVFTTNNKAALIASGSEIPVPATTVSGFAGGSSDLVNSSSISYENVLLQLSIIPVINANHQITLRIRQSNDSIGGSQTISGNSIPIIDTQKLDTEVTVPDRSTIVIGGLIADNNERDTSGLPWISDIPLLGYLFKDTKKTKTRTELIIMIQPSVVETEGDQVVVNEAEKRRTILGQEAEESPDGSTVTPPVTGVVTRTREVSIQPPGPNGQPARATTTTVISSSPVSPNPSLVPAASSPAPDVGKAKLPKDAPVVPSPTPLP
jgi:general secretion pathway protein D